MQEINISDSFCIIGVSRLLESDSLRIRHDCTQFTRNKQKDKINWWALKSLVTCKKLNLQFNYLLGYCSLKNTAIWLIQSILSHNCTRIPLNTGFSMENHELKGFLYWISSKKFKLYIFFKTPEALYNDGHNILRLLYISLNVPVTKSDMKLHY